MALVGYGFDGDIATIRMDDGKVNALSPEMITEVWQALDKASTEAKAVVLTGREGMFSAGFSLPVLRAGGQEAFEMLKGGFALAERMLMFPLPLVAACPGHAVAMASFLLLSVDYRIGVRGPFKITANEVAIGLAMPHTAVEICRHRLVPPYFHRAVVLAEVFSPAMAVEAGFLDEVVDPEQLDAAAHEVATGLAALDRTAHQATKLRARAAVMHAVKEAVAVDFGDQPPA